MFTIEPVLSAATPVFAQAWQLYEEAFPPEERRSLPQQDTLLQEPAYSFNAIFHKKDLVGILGFWQLPSVVFLEHFAIHAAGRGQGLGEKVLQQFLAESSAPVVLEVEPPATELARRRIRFYERLGFLLHSFPYQQPPYSPEKPWVPLQLMSFPKALALPAFETMVQDLYRQVYKVDPRASN
ncbi:GNAT family N-acetyltransferase [Nibribacter ruber]|uniref:GNAT family N-acetyltransferase n=1 Tax=Nibribacter ruber TaxID=2698458 RepID=A0A6P1P3W1_9BACT|nr:GNAT family N-acetyltransferase [Nibribacter ruber]QHL89127.1 GNAT family N-acetyltransferase [Nibribacter ruber]